MKGTEGDCLKLKRPAWRNFALLKVVEEGPAGSYVGAGVVEPWVVEGAGHSAAS